MNLNSFSFVASLIRKKVSFPGHSPFESSAAHEEYEDTLVFSGSVGNISVGGDVLIDNNGRKMFKDEIMQTVCKVCFNIKWIRDSLITRIHKKIPSSSIQYPLLYL